MSQSLTFQSTTFDVIDRNGSPWLQSRQLAKALRYKDEGSVNRIYERNKDEFTESMVSEVNLTLPGNLPIQARIFSLRGCHLIAMFARTQRAKAFRVWVLDVLETLNKAEARQHPLLDTTSRLSKRTDPERKELTAMVGAWVNSSPIGYAAARTIVNAHFGVRDINDLTVEQVKEAVRFVQGKIAEQPKALPAPEPEVKQLALPVPERRNTPYSDLAFTAGNDILDAMDLLVKAMGKIMPLSANEESLTGGSMASLAHKMTSNAVSSIANVHALLIRVSRSC